MKKIILVSAVAITFLLTSCSSGWSCQKRYCNAKQVKTKTIEQKKNA
jgi:PBP1b-binding outer membrane lipoprotein LpoB